MNGTVTGLRKRGVEAGLYGISDAQPGMRFQIYRVVGGSTVVIANGVVKHVHGGKVRINYDTVVPRSVVQIGDLVKSI